MDHTKQRQVSSRLYAMPCCEPTQDWRLCMVTMESRSTRQAIDMVLHGQKPLITAEKLFPGSCGNPEASSHAQRPAQHWTPRLATLVPFSRCQGTVNTLNSGSLATLKTLQHGNWGDPSPHAIRGDWHKTRGRLLRQWKHAQHVMRHGFDIQDLAYRLVRK